jgi:DNA-binding NarL/FixJ family response regulator
MRNPTLQPDNRLKAGLSTHVPGGAPLVIVCGEILPQSILGSNLFWAANRLSLVRCSEEPIDILSLCEKLRPSLVIAKQGFIEALPDHDIALMTGPEHHAHVLVLLNEEGPEAGRRMLQLGCHGVLPLKFPAKLLRRAVPAILAGELWAPRLVISAMLLNLLKARTEKRENRFTPREQHILELVGRGYRNAEIASSLFISHETVRWHKRRIYRKIGRAHVPVTEMPSRRLSPPSQERNAQSG